MEKQKTPMKNNDVLAFGVCSMNSSFSLFLFPLFFLLSFPSYSAEGAEPKLRVLNPIASFGEIESGKPAEVTFSLKNEGDAQLEILEIQPGCGCTAAMVQDPKIAPGETGQLKATLDTKDFSGRQSKTVRIGTNDPNHRSVVLTLEGVVRADFEINPSRLYFGKVRLGSAPSKSFTVKIRPGTNYQISEILGSRGNLTVSAGAPAAPGGERTVDVKLSPDFPLGFFSERVTLKTTSTKNPIVMVPVSGLVEGDVTVVPPSVGFGLVELPLKAPLSQVLRLSVQGEQPVKILSAEAANSLVETKIEEVKPGKQYNVLLSLPQDISEQTLQSEVKIVTDHPNPAQREIRVAVNGSFVKRRE